ncbi:hypothetical protein [Sinomonas mesophila]|uniref:hypothetical protein n=1 Tax=Sinomonas mesophila TaxID=1531955 RepID=UPI00098586E4|nr:hypothetical protein [Sinomonas mesophila]
MSSDVSTAESGRPDAESDDRLKAALHRVFDGQIPNYGDYNLVCATECGGTVTGQVPGAPAPRGLVLGYRRRPVELVLAPFDRTSLAPAGQPATIDLTNLAYVTVVGQGAYDVATSTGRVVTFTLRADCALPHAGASAGTLHQEDDAADLAAFLEELAAL